MKMVSLIRMQWIEFMNKIYIENGIFLRTKTLICLDIPREELEDFLMRLFEDIKFTDEQLQPTVDWCKDNTEFSPVITKFNKQKSMDEQYQLEDMQMI